MRRTRTFSALVASAIITSSMLAAAPAAAAPGEQTIVLENSTFNEGSWGEGLSGVASGFVPGAALLVTAFQVDPGTGEQYPYMDVLNAQADADGSYIFADLVPPVAPIPEGRSFFQVVSLIPAPGEVGPDIGSIELTINPAAGETAPTVTVAPTCSTVDEVRDAGVVVTASGFEPGESLTDALTAPDGSPVGESFTEVADENGTAVFQYVLTDDVEPGIYTETVTRSTGESFSTSFTVGNCTTEAPGTTALAATGLSPVPLTAGAALLLLAGLAALASLRRARSTG